jgi:ubiquitin carboxyl-terminal hydrolase 48
MTKPKRAASERGKKTINKNVPVGNDEVDHYGAIANPVVVCTVIDHKKKKNCANNPWCLFGLIDDKKKGIWKPRPTGLIELGNDPLLLSRRLQNTFILKPCGLQNLGATCYLNVLIQMLFQNLLIRDAVFNMLYDEKKTNHLAINMIVYALQDTFGHLDQCIKGQYDISYLIDLLKLDRNEQQDPEEFSNLLLAKLEECKLPLKTSEISNVKELTTGKQKYLTICQECGTSTGQINEFHDLELNLAGCENLTTALDTYFSEEVVEGDNQIFCENCEKKVHFKRQIKIESWPDSLNLKLKRYYYDTISNDKKKCQSELSFPAELNFGEEQFVLTAVLYHKVRIYLSD